MAPVIAAAAAARPTQKALIAHVLRRTTFGPFPGQVELNPVLPLLIKPAADRPDWCP